MSELVELIDTDPVLAIEKANEIFADDFNSLSLKASVYIDAGARIKDTESIEKGEEIFRRLCETFPDSPNLKYNLGNSLNAKANAVKFETRLKWLEDTHAYRIEARSLFYSVVASKDATHEIKSQAYTNLANIHKDSMRWLEAYEYYRSALNEVPGNGTASMGALNTLIYADGQELGDPDSIFVEMQNHVANILANQNVISKYSGTSALEHILCELEKLGIEAKVKLPLDQTDSYVCFIMENNLALSPTVDASLQEMGLWDDLYIESIYSTVEDGPYVPAVFSMFNVIKADYSLARRLIYQALNDVFDDNGRFAETDDYALYGINQSALLLAQRCSMDILDKLAVATLSYLEVGGARSTDFKKAWFSGIKKEKKLHTKIRKEIEEGNSALTALVEISYDLTEPAGYLKPKSDMRNSSTHRFSILHDINPKDENTNSCIERFDVGSFSHDALMTLKLVRSAIVHFMHMIKLRENRLGEASEGLVFQMEVDHVEP
jgi:tetratricopeptide (TPR) repeat protein